MWDRRFWNSVFMMKGMKVSVHIRGCTHQHCSVSRPKAYKACESILFCSYVTNQISCDNDCLLEMFLQSGCQTTSRSRLSSSHNGLSAAIETHAPRIWSPRSVVRQRHCRFFSMDSVLVNLETVADAFQLATGPSCLIKCA